MALGPMEVVCNAPHISICEAVNAIDGFKPDGKVPGALDSRWERFAKKNQCHVCNKAKGRLKFSQWKFTYGSGDEVYYWIARCPVCRTVFWHEVK